MATKSAFLGALERFDPSSNDWTLYSERFEHFVKANSIKDEAFGTGSSGRSDVPIVDESRGTEEARRTKVR